jgi:hypothetical protein
MIPPVFQYQPDAQDNGHRLTKPMKDQKKGRTVLLLPGLFLSEA